MLAKSFNGVGRIVSKKGLAPVKSDNIEEWKDMWVQMDELEKVQNVKQASAWTSNGCEEKMLKKKITLHSHPSHSHRMSKH
eukprot:gene12168-5658_t